MTDGDHGVGACGERKVERAEVRVVSRLRANLVEDLGSVK